LPQITTSKLKNLLKSPHATLAGVVLALFVAGCAKFQAKPLNPGKRAAVLTSRRLSEKTWTLDSLTKQALANSPDVAVARAQYAVAHAAIITAGERPNPTVALSPQVVTPYTDWIAGTYGVDFDWTFETAGKRGRRLEVAHEQARAAAARVVDATWKVRGATRRAMLELYAAERRAALIDEATKKQVEIVTLTVGRVKAGAASAMETAQPRLLAAQLRLQGSEASRSLALGRASLAEALTMSIDGLDGAKFSYTAFQRTPGRQASHRRAALTHRADVLAALAEYAAAEGTLRLEIAKQYPDIHLNPGYQLDAGENKWALGIGLTLPILNQNKGAIGEADAKRKEAAAKFDAVQAKVLADCDRAAARVAAARSKLATIDGMLAEQRQQIESFQHIVAAGEGDRISVVSAEVELATTRIAQLDAMIELHSALGALEEATQTPLEQ
jgi:outer membrane protein TolC